MEFVVLLIRFGLGDPLFREKNYVKLAWLLCRREKKESVENRSSLQLLNKLAGMKSKSIWKQGQVLTKS